MHKFFGLLLVIWSFSLLGGCAGMMRSSLNPPDVSLQTFKLLPQQGVGPRFEIGLHIINPNREPLNFIGIYYTVDIEWNQRRGNQPKPTNKNQPKIHQDAEVRSRRF